VELISYRGEPAAVVVSGDLTVFAPELEARGWDDPVFRFVAAMCRLAMEIELGLEHGPYEGYAREALSAHGLLRGAGGTPGRVPGDLLRRSARAGSRPAR
jgi:hypothetical protein